MSKYINVTSSLVYYDGVQVFDALDAIGGRYIGVLVDASPESDCRYLVVGVSPSDLQAFRLGQLDLRTLLLERPETDWFTADIEVNLSKPLTLRVHSETIPEAYLPEDDFFLVDEMPESSLIAVHDEALARNRVAIELKLDPPESVFGHSIRAQKLGDLLIHMQSFVRHAFAKSIAGLTESQRRDIDRNKAPLLDVVVPAQPGSFRIILAASQKSSLFGGGDITRALDVFDEIAAAVNDPEETLECLRRYRGRVATSYLRLLRFIADNDVSMQYAWSEPSRGHVSSHGITRKQAEPVLIALAGLEILGKEQVTLIGLLKKIDVDSGRWRLYVPDEKKEHSGMSRPEISLSHLVTDRTYRFVCDEEIAEAPGTGREKKTLYLTEFSDLESQS